MPDELTPLVDLRSFDHYIDSCISLAHHSLSGYASLAQIEACEAEINRYPRLDRLGPPRHLVVLEDGDAQALRVERAREALARGRVLLEHTAAGEGTRLMLGPKYLLNLGRNLSLAALAHDLSQEYGREVTPAALARELDVLPQELLPISLGNRHMLQLAFDLANLVRGLGADPREVLPRQHILVIVSEELAARIEREFRQWHFFGFDRRRVFFMVQQSFHGLSYRAGRFMYDQAAPRRLHNHGQMVMQETMDRQLFTWTGPRAEDRRYLSRQEAADWLAGFDDKISYNIEDLDYLTGSLDLPALGLALELGEQGYHMVMEVVANNPESPQKGGMLAWDAELGREVMIESFQLGGLPKREIQFLNRNFNHYPQPLQSWRRVGEAGLPMPVAVKEGFLYFQPVQGDINFLVNTAFFRRQELKPIRNLKNQKNLPLAINCLAAQDRQPGFSEFARRLWEGHP